MGERGGARSGAVATLLVVEDDPLVRAALVRVLRGHCSVVDCGTMTSGIALAFQQVHLQGVLTDHQLPDGTGVELLWRLRLGGCQVPAVIHTADPLAADVRFAVRAGLAGWVVAKPAANAVLLAAVQRMMGS